MTLSSQPELNSSKTEEGEQKAKSHKAECKAKKRNRKAKGLELIKNRKWLTSNFIELNTHQHCFNYLEAKVKHFEEDQQLHQEALKVKKSQSMAHAGPTIQKMNGCYKMGRWTKDEHFRFLEALKLFGKEWKKVQEHVMSRTST